MSERVVGRRRWGFSVTVTPGVADGKNPQTQIELGLVALKSAHLDIPRGHRNLTGFALVYAGQFIWPWSNSPNWLVGDNTSYDVDFNDLELGGILTLDVFNSGQFNHTFNGWIEVIDIERNTPTSIQIVV